MSAKRTRKMRARRWYTAALAVTTILGAPAAAPAQARQPRPLAVGPVDATNGFPMWYRDADGTALAPCIDPLDPLCNIPAGEVPEPSRPIVFPTNFPAEAFYMLGEAQLTTSGGDALVLVGLEAAFSVDVVRDGDQMVFGRVRIRIDLPDEAAGRYTVTHPYGVDVFDVTAGGRRAINLTEDIGTVPQDFTAVTIGRVNPFLRWAGGEPPAGYIGDPAVPHEITGSPYGTNFVRIQGPGIGAGVTGFECPADVVPGGDDCIQTNLFALQGKLARNGGVEVDRAIYARDAEGHATLAVFARSMADKKLVLTGDDVARTDLAGAGEDYVAHVPTTAGTPGGVVTVTNTSDTPDSSRTVLVTDAVAVTEATWSAESQQLVVRARSSDRAGAPRLTVVGYGDLGAPIDGVAAASFRVRAPPAWVTVRSAGGGADTEAVELVGTPAAPPPAEPEPTAPVAYAGPGQTVQPGATVTLVGFSSGPVTSAWWSQTKGAPVDLVRSSVDPYVVTFRAPADAASLEFQFRVENGATGAWSAASTTVQVQGPLKPDAGSTIVAVPGSLVTLAGSATGGTAPYRFQWSQEVAPPLVEVPLANPDAATTTFTFPSGVTAPLKFVLTVVDADGTKTSTSVLVEPAAEDLRVSLAEFRADKREWRVSGTSSVTAGNRVTIELVSARGTFLVGTADVDPLGDWTFRVRDAGVTASNGDTLTLETRAGTVRKDQPLTVR